jgi:hypothetical protein
LDFLKLLRSFEDLLFEVLTWIIYYPRTLWMVVRHPLQMLDYSNHEQMDEEQEQYTDTMSPPLLLLLTLVFAHVVEINTHQESIRAGSAMARAIVASDQNVIALRAVVFGLLPLFGAANYVRSKNLPLERKYLRGPFFAECYAATVFALMVATTTTMSTLFPSARPLLLPVGYTASTIWFLTVEVLQMRRSLGFSIIKALMLATWNLVKALVIVIAVGLALAGQIP